MTEEKLEDLIVFDGRVYDPSKTDDVKGLVGDMNKTELESSRKCVYHTISALLAGVGIATCAYVFNTPNEIDSFVDVLKNCGVDSFRLGDYVENALSVVGSFFGAVLAYDTFQAVKYGIRSNRCISGKKKVGEILKKNSYDITETNLGVF